jgi:hypothetical protein
MSVTGTRRAPDGDGSSVRVPPAAARTTAPVRRADTSPDAHARQVAVYRAMTPAERVATAVAMSEDAAAIAAAGIAARHRDYDSDEVRRAYLRLCWGDELYAAVFPGAPLPDP